MKKKSTTRQQLFYALAEPTRRDILELLANKGQLAASDIYENFEVSAPAISQHLKILREADLVLMEKRAQQHIYNLNPGAMTEIETWIQKMTKNWNDRFNMLDKVLQEEKKKIKSGNEKI
ncbi:MAG: metalloregulator ArsR/SmtB family transcription factor [Thaumarchaeota archaeon]|nr:metalloregulator ArsR/SmtB family transcription factor [Nitrososphaerota archaeon]